MNLGAAPDVFWRDGHENRETGTAYGQLLVSLSTETPAFTGKNEGSIPAGSTNSAS